jgi:hypothetical protein
MRRSIFTWFQGRAPVLNLAGVRITGWLRRREAVAWTLLVARSFLNVVSGKTVKLLGPDVTLYLRLFQFQFDKI